MSSLYFTSRRSSFTYTTQAQVRDAFWETSPGLTCRRSPRGRILPQNEQPADTRAAFVEFVDSLQRNGDISEALADRVTL